MSIVTHEQTSAGWTVDDSAFGARLALIRIRMDWNVKEAARACGLPAASWRTWERDGAMPRRIVETAKLISGATGCDYLWLLTGTPTGDGLPPSGGGATRRYQPSPAPRHVSAVHKRPPNRIDDIHHPRGRDHDPHRPVLVRGNTNG